MGNWKQEPQSLLPTAEPTRDDVLFFAGFYDGEGSACGASNGSTIVQVPQKDPEVILRGRSLWGGSLRQPKGLDIWVWVMSGDRARKFLQDVYPFLSNRRKVQIEAAGGLQMTGRKTLAVSGMDAERRDARAAMTETQRHSETCARWAASNPEKIKAGMERYQARNREKINARHREYRSRIRESKAAARNDVHQLIERSTSVN